MKCTYSTCDKYGDTCCGECAEKETCDIDYKCDYENEYDDCKEQNEE